MVLRVTSSLRGLREVMTADVNKGITYRLDAGIDLIEVPAERQAN